MDSNHRSRFTYSPFRNPSCRLRDGPVRQNGNRPFATGYRAFEARFRRRVYRATAWGLSTGALPVPLRVGRSPPIVLWQRRTFYLNDLKPLGVFTLLKALRADIGRMGDEISK